MPEFRPGVLGSAMDQRDPGMGVHSSLKMVTHVDRVVWKAFGTLAFIAEDVEHRNWNSMLQDFGKATFGGACTVLVAQL